MTKSRSKIDVRVESDKVEEPEGTEGNGASKPAGSLRPLSSVLRIWVICSEKSILAFHKDRW